MDIPRTAKRSAKYNANETIFSGVLILTISNLLVKVLGMFFKIPMNYILGDTGMGYYNAAYTIYTFFYMLSTAGLPVAVSVMVAAARADGQKKQCRRILQTALVLFFSIGLAGTAIMGIFPAALASMIGAAPAAECILAISPTLFFICITSALRGYFQGCSRMVPTAVSQLLEASCKVAAGILGALYGIRQNAPPHVTAAYAIAGLTLGAAVSMLYLMLQMFFTREDNFTSVEQEEFLPYRVVFRRLAAIAVPITLSSAVMNLTGMIDTLLLQRLLQQNGLSQEAAVTLYGNYTSLAVPMFNLPPVLVYPIAYAVVPLLAKYGARDKREEARTLIHAALRIAVLIGMPCSFGLAAMAEPILKLLYREASATTAAPLLTLLAPSSLLVCILAVTNAVLQSVGKAGLPVVSMLAGAMVKGVAVVLLVPSANIAAAPVSTFASYLTVTAMNLYFMIKHTGLHMDIKALTIKPIAASFLCAGTALGIYHSACLIIPEKLSVMTAVLAAVLVYVFMLRTLHILSRADMVLLPANRKLCRLLGIPENCN